MPSLGDIKRRIKSVKNTQQITKAMKMVSASKLKRAQDEIVAARPYAGKMLEMISRLAASTAAASAAEDETTEDWVAVTGGEPGAPVGDETYAPEEVATETPAPEELVADMSAEPVPEGQWPETGTAAKKDGKSYVAAVLGMIPGRRAKAPKKQHPLLLGAGGLKKGVVLITSDRGLCGSFNAVMLRTVENFLAENAEAEPALYLLGRRGIEHFKRRDLKVLSSRPVGNKRPDYAMAAGISKEFIELYLSGELDEVYVIYSEFKSALTQHPRIQKILPITPEAADEGGDTGEEAEYKADVKFLYEPSTDDVLEDLLPKYVEVQLFRALLESSASEHGARMTAMDGASRSAADMIDSLTLKYNRLRQAAITKELMEIISGAESLKS